MDGVVIAKFPAVVKQEDFGVVVYDCCPGGRRELLAGGGSRRHKFMYIDHKEWSNLVTLDINGDHNPDVVWDLNHRPLPFEDNSFNELHFYEVLEHIGQQGDYRGLFDEFSEYWRILKPGGMLFGTSPNHDCKWAWGDPGHTRIISPQIFHFLSQPNYEQVGQTPMSDYRFCYRADFDLFFSNVHTEGEIRSFQYALRAVKPARINSTNMKAI